MVRRVVVALLGPVAWTPPGIDPARWRTALAEDVVDLLATLSEVETAVAVTSADRPLADAVVWPDMAVYEVAVPTVNAVFAALTAYDQAAVVAADAPDVPALTLGKLLRPLSSRPVAVAPVEAPDRDCSASRRGCPYRSGCRRWTWTRRCRRTSGSARRARATSRSPPAGGGCAARRTWPRSTPPSRAGTPPVRCSPATPTDRPATQRDGGLTPGGGHRR